MTHDVRSELRSIDQQLDRLEQPGLPARFQRQAAALRERAHDLIVQAGMWGVGRAAYVRGLQGGEVNATGSGALPKAPVAAAAQPRPLARPAAAVMSARPLAPVASVVPSAIAARALTRPHQALAPEPPRAAHIAAGYLPAINAARKSNGFQPLSAAQLEVEFADIGRMPARRARASRRARANAIVAGQLVAAAPSQSEGAWASIAGRLNASREAFALQARAGAPGAPRGSQSQGEIDGAWSAQAHALNSEAGLRTSARRA